MEIEIEGGALLYRRPILNGTVLSLMAETVRQQTTGLHAKVIIRMNATPLAWSNFNVERDEDRLRLANSAYRQFSKEAIKVYSKEYLKNDLDLFCLELGPKSLELLKAEEMRGELIPPGFRYVLKPWIVRGGGTILFALPGMGKSYIAKIMGVMVDAGLMSMWEVAPCKVLLVNLERSRSSVAHRLYNVNEALGLDPNRPLLTFNARGKRLSAIYGSLQRTIEEQGVGFTIVDSLSRTGYGDLTENEPVNEAADALNGLCQSWMAVAHAPRPRAGEIGHTFGSVMWDAAADVVVSLQSEAKNDLLGLKLEMTKANDIRKARPEVVSLRFNEDGLCGISKAEEWQFPRLMARGEVDMGDAIVDYLLEQGKADATTIAKELGFLRPHVSELLSHDPRFTCLGREGKKVLYAVKSEKEDVYTQRV